MVSSIYMGEGRVISAYCDATVTGGDIVYATSGDDAVTMAMSSYAASDITVEKCNAVYDPNLVVGIALTTGVSGAAISVISEGMFILSGATVTAGSRLCVSGVGNAVMDADTTTTEMAIGSAVGRALTGTSAATGKFCIANLDFA